MTIAISGAPPYAAKIWADSRSIYLELAGATGPYILSFAHASAYKAFAILTDRYQAEGHGEVYIRPPATMPDKKGISEQHRQNVRDILKRARAI